jgi:hypothetical protein
MQGVNFVPRQEKTSSIGSSFHFWSFRNRIIGMGRGARLESCGTLIGWDAMIKIDSLVKSPSAALGGNPAPLDKALSLSVECASIVTNKNEKSC